MHKIKLLILIFIILFSSYAQSRTLVAVTGVAKVSQFRSASSSARIDTYTLNTCTGATTISASGNVAANAYYPGQIEKTWHYDDGTTETSLHTLHDSYRALVTTVVPIGGCVPPPPCNTERQAKIAECGGESYVNWSGWSDDTCSGATCCPSGNFLVGSGSCIPECPYISGRTPTTLNNYGNGLCVDPECGSGELENADGKCEPICIPPAQLDVTTGDCFVPVVNCGPCETKVNNDCLAPEVCPSQTWRNMQTCECTDNEPPICGPGRHWNGVSCVADEITRCPDGKVKNIDGDCVADPNYCPSGTAKNPATDQCEPVTQPDESAPELDPDATDLALQRNMDENARRLVDNSKIIGESTQRIETGISGLKSSVDGVRDAVDDIDTQGIIDAIENLELNGSDGVGVDDVICPDGYTKVGIECKENPPIYEEIGLGDTVGGYAVGSYNERYSDMVSNIMGTEIAELIDFGVDTIPAGTSVISYDLGSNFGGAQTFDFAEFNNIWAIFRSVLLIVFSFLAVRIVILKK